MGCSQFKCTQRLLSGELCPSAFPRAWNLKRHVEVQHGKQATTFVECSPNGKRKRSLYQGDDVATLSPQLPTPTDRSLRRASTQQYRALSSASTNTGIHSRSSAGSPALTSTGSNTDALSMMSGRISSLPNELGLSRSESPAASNGSPISYASSGNTDTSEGAPPDKRLRQVSIPTEGSNDARTSDARTSDAVSEHPHASEGTPFLQRPSPASIVNDGGASSAVMATPDRTMPPPSVWNAQAQSREEKALSKLRESDFGPTGAAIHTCGRSFRAAARDPVPLYDVKTSKTFQSQQRGLDWLTGKAKTVFDERYETLLSRWGVKPGYQGTCIQVPDEWRLADPHEIHTRLDQQALPTSDSSRAFYSYSDHTTTLARAKAWFSQWPRTGVQLDNFLECGPFQAMDASHRCHRDHCIIHVIYEAAHTNVDRCDCQRTAKRLRQEGKDVPEHCDKHEPPCLMQHASLTRRESYGIQFDVLSSAQGLPPQPETVRPRRYLFPTFEGRLPTRFSAMMLNEAMLVSQPLARKNAARPNILCKFCPTIRNFASIYGFWTHVFLKHDTTDTSIRLEEMHRAAGLWRTYWDQHSNGGKYSNATQSKLDQMEKPGFSWDDVIAWQLH